MQWPWNPAIPAAIDKMLELYGTSAPMNRGLGPPMAAASPLVWEVYL